MEMEEEEEEATREYDELSPEEKAMIQLKNFINQIPVLGFNSAKYDLQLVKQMLARVLKLDQSGGTSYDVFLKAYKCQQTKSYFPYEWFNDASKLDHPALPEFNAFYSHLKQHNVLDSEYDSYQKLLDQGLSSEDALKKLQI